MGMLDGLMDTLTGGLGGKIIDAISAYFPPDLTPEQKANIALAAENVLLQKQIENNKAVSQAENDLTNRIAQLEGTATDLKAIPFIGPLMLFIRGAQRPVWGLGTLYFDYHVLSGGWALESPVLQNLLWIVNFLVLTFLFGERAVMNVLPFFTEMFKARSAANSTTK